MILGDDKPSLEATLAHFGVKGMKWGVRKAYADRVTKKNAPTKRVSEGRGSLLDKARTLPRVSTTDLVRGRGLKGAAKIQSKRVEDHAQRVASGNAKVKDILVMAGGLKISDLVRGARNASTA